MFFRESNTGLFPTKSCNLCSEPLPWNSPCGPLRLLMYPLSSGVVSHRTMSHLGHHGLAVGPPHMKSQMYRSYPLQETLLPPQLITEHKSNLNPVLCPIVYVKAIPPYFFRHVSDDLPALLLVRLCGCSVALPLGEDSKYKRGKTTTHVNIKHPSQHHFWWRDSPPNILIMSLVMKKKRIYA